MKQLIDVINESILSDIDITLKKGDEQMKFGSHFTLEKIYGDDDVLMCIKGSKLRGIVDGLKPFSNNTASVIEDFERTASRPGFGISRFKLEALNNMITVIENMTIPIINDFNDKSFKSEVTSNLTSILQEQGVIPANATIYNGNKLGGDAKGIFQLHMDYKYTSITFVYKIK
jgi:hypothetical protein